MRLSAVLERPSGAFESILVVADSSSTVEDLARVIVELDPQGEYASPTFQSALALEVRTIGTGDFETFVGRDNLADLALGSGVVLKVVPEETAPRTPIGSLSVVRGPDAGLRQVLYRGTTTIGREASCDLALSDLTVSKVHARIHAAPDRVEIVDLGSANGVVLGDALVSRADLTLGTPVRLGSTVIVAQLAAEYAAPAPSIKLVRHTRSPRVEVRFASKELESAELPTEGEKQPFPWLVMALPMLAGVVMFMVTKSLMSLTFVAMSPLMMLGTWATNVMRRKDQMRKGIAKFDDQLSRLSVRLDDERGAEREARCAEAPSLAEVDVAVRQRTPLLWTRRPEHWSFLYARLGFGRAPSRVTVKDPQGRDRALAAYEERFDSLIGKYTYIDDVPIVEDFTAMGSLGIAGPTEIVAAYARGLLAQLAGLHAPSDVRIMGVAGPGWSEALADAVWLPHVDAAQRDLGVALGSSPQGCLSVVSLVEEIVSGRTGDRDRPVSLGALAQEQSAVKSGGRVGERGGAPLPHSAPLPAVVLLIADDAPIDKSRLIALSERAAGSGVYPVWLTRAVTDLPAACRTVVEFDDAAVAAVHFVRLGSTISDVQVEGFSAAQMRDFALSLARVVDTGAVDEENADLPRIVPLVDLLGRSAASDPASVVDRWLQNGSIPSGSGTPRGYAPKLRALIGQAATGALHVDLRAEGPHALVGGTTGSGKSEFLQAWVLAMAAEYSPQRVTFLFVDYKGGSAFADCVHLPHYVGLVTDLSPHLVRRALVSLRAELHYREHLFNAKGAKDILELERRGDPDCPPALVLVIDEFAALVSEVPDFVDGVVDIAQRGRSLGIHLIMATQRPAGVIKDNLRANTNLRVALRMADESDSMDVVGTKLAAQFPPEQRGRGAVKSGPGRITLFQAAYSGGHAFDELAAGEPEVSSLGFAPPQRWTRTQDADAAPVNRGEKPTDQQRLVQTMGEAAEHAGIPAPRRPWLDELPAVVDLVHVIGGSDRRIPFGLVDVPQRQEQERLVFEPDVDQNMVIFGAGGSGRTGTLRSLAIAAGCVEEGAVHVYVIDAGGTGLAMLEAMPHVGAVVSGDDSERVMRLARYISTVIDERTAALAAAGAESLVDFRVATGRPLEPRILILIDNFASLRAEYEGVPGRAEAYASLTRAMQEGRGVGVHLVMTSDRAASINNSLMATIQKKLVLRMADNDGYSVLGVPRDILGPESPVGRGAIGKLECHVGVWQGLTNARDLKNEIARIAPRMPAAAWAPAPPILALPSDYSLASLPTDVAGEPVLALSDVALAAHPLEPVGTVLVAGGSETGKTTAMLGIAQSLVRWRHDAVLFFLGARRSQLSRWAGWDVSGLEATDIAAIDDAIEAAATGGPPVALFIESATDFGDTPSEGALIALLRKARMDGLLVVAEVDPQDLGGYSGLKAELKNGRRGMVLRPETSDGDGVLKTPFPRIDRSEFTPGRGLWAANGKVARIQMPRPLEGDAEAALLATRPSRTFAVATSSSSATSDAKVAATQARAVPDWAKAPTR